MPAASFGGIKAVPGLYIQKIATSLTHQGKAAAKIEESAPPVITNTESDCVMRPEVKASWVYKKEAVCQSSSRSQRYIEQLANATGNYDDRLLIAKVF